MPEPGGTGIGSSVSGGHNPRDQDQDDDSKRRKRRRSFLADADRFGFGGERGGRGRGPQTPVEANVGNLSGLGGFRDIIGEAIMGRRRKRGARSLAVGDTLAETTRKTLFGL